MEIHPYLKCSFNISPLNLIFRFFKTFFAKICKLVAYQFDRAEAATRGIPKEKVFLEISQNS